MRMVCALEGVCKRSVCIVSVCNVNVSARPNLRAPEGNKKRKGVVSREPAGSDNIAFSGIYLQDP